jgi:hypothetical protein
MILKSQLKVKGKRLLFRLLKVSNENECWHFSFLFSQLSLWRSLKILRKVKIMQQQEQQRKGFLLTWSCFSIKKKEHVFALKRFFKSWEMFIVYLVIFLLRSFLDFTVTVTVLYCFVMHGTKNLLHTDLKMLNLCDGLELCNTLRVVWIRWRRNYLWPI